LAKTKTKFHEECVEMAKVINPLLSGSASGQFGGMMTFDKRGYVRQYVIPANPQTVDQMAVRNKMGDIQRCLKMLGTTIRADLRLALGARWNAVIISEIMATNAAKWDSLAATYNAFQAGEKTAWEGANPGSGFVANAGLVFFITAQSLYDVALRIGGDGLITDPAAANSAIVAGEWVA
jgi:hypothetical protein